MPKIYLLFIIAISFFTVSQEINNEYLESLPEDIRNDVLERMGENAEIEERAYTSQDTTSDIYKDELEEDEDIIFGSNFFDTFQTSFMPINIPNLDDKYILDFGDILSIQLIGQTDSINSYQLQRDGSINIPNVGKLYLSGLS